MFVIKLISIHFCLGTDYSTCCLFQIAPQPNVYYWSGSNYAAVKVLIQKKEFILSFIRMFFFFSGIRRCSYDWIK
jgi:hypothetical protein